jgi:hypothetical protein
MMLKEPLNKSLLARRRLLRDGMRERRRREWLIPFARSLTRQTARAASAIGVAVKSGETAKGRAVSSTGRCGPVADCWRPVCTLTKSGIPAAARSRPRAPSGNALGSHGVALLGIVVRATASYDQLRPASRAL